MPVPPSTTADYGNHLGEILDVLGLDRPTVGASPSARSTRSPCTASGRRRSAPWFSSPHTPGGPGPGRRKRPSATYGRPSGICPLRSSRRSRNAADPAHGSRITGRRRTRRDDDARLPPNRRPPGRDRSAGRGSPRRADDHRRSDTAHLRRRGRTLTRRRRGPGHAHTHPRLDARSHPRRSAYGQPPTTRGI